MNLFTPREGIVRHSMMLDDDDFAAVLRHLEILGYDWQEIVTDRNTGKRYLVAGAPCSNPNHNCDVVIVREMALN